MIIATVPLLVCVIGALIYALTTRAELKEMGRLMFACGLLVALFVAAKHVVNI
jgi:Na+/phosphate symporter